jgi:hypothetical protein
LIACFTVSFLCFNSAKADDGFVDSPLVDAKYEELKSKIIAASKVLETGDFDAFVTSLPGWDANKKGTIDFLTLANEKRRVLPEKLGEPLSCVELVREEMCGTSFCQLCFAERFTSGLVFWRIIYYRGEDGWQPKHLHFNNGEFGLQVSPSTKAKLDERPREIAESIMKDIVSDKVSEVTAALEKATPPESKVQLQRIALTVQLEAINGNVSLNDYELTKTETAGPSLVRYYFVSRRKNQGHHVQLTFYRSKEDWMLTGWAWSNEAQPTFVARDESSLSVR